MSRTVSQIFAVPFGKLAFRLSTYGPLAVADSALTTKKQSVSPKLVGLVPPPVHRFGDSLVLGDCEEVGAVDVVATPWCSS